MKHVLFLLAMVSIAFSSVFSQISLNTADFPDADDTAMISISNEFGVDFETTGADMNWDFSDLVISAQRIDTFYDVSDASWTLQIAFNNFLDSDYESEYFNNFQEFDPPETGGVGLSFGNTVIFTKYNSGSIEKTGIGMTVNDIEIPAQYEDKDQAFELPINDGDSWSDYSFLDIDLNPAFNGILRRHQDRSAVVDGWGTVTTWYGTFDVLRIRMDLTYTDSVFVEFGGSGTWLELPTPDRHEYLWMTNGQKVPVMKIVTTGPSGTEVVSGVEFKDIDRGFLTVNDRPSISVGYYPNPTTDLLYFQSGQEINLISLMDMQGKVLQVDPVESKEGYLDYSAQPVGVYQLLFETTNGSLTKRLIID